MWEVVLGLLLLLGSSESQRLLSLISSHRRAFFLSYLVRVCNFVKLTVQRLRNQWIQCVVLHGVRFELFRFASDRFAMQLRFEQGFS